MPKAVEATAAVVMAMVATAAEEAVGWAAAAQAVAPMVEVGTVQVEAALVVVEMAQVVVVRAVVGVERGAVEGERAVVAEAMPVVAKALEAAARERAVVEMVLAAETTVVEAKVWMEVDWESVAVVTAAERALVAVVLVEVGVAKAVDASVMAAAATARVGAATAVAAQAVAVRAGATLGEMVVTQEGSYVRAERAGAVPEATTEVVTEGA